MTHFHGQLPGAHPHGIGAFAPSQGGVLQGAAELPTVQGSGTLAGAAPLVQGAAELAALGATGGLVGAAAPPPPPPPPPVLQGAAELAALLASGGLQVLPQASLGVLGSLCPTTGPAGPSVLGAAVQLLGLQDVFVRLVITQPAAGLSFFTIDEYGSFEAEGPDGLHTFFFRLEVNGQVHPLNDGFGPGIWRVDLIFASGTSGVLLGAGTLADIVGAGAVSGSPPLPPAPPPPPLGFRPGRRLTVPYSAPDRRALPDLTHMLPGETLLVVFDFSPLAAVSGPQISVLQLGGVDNRPMVSAVGEPVVEGARVLQRFAGGTPGNTYVLRCSAQTADGQVVQAAGRMPVRTWV